MINTLVGLFLCVASAIAQEVTSLQPMQVKSHPSQEVVVELLISGSGLADASPRFFGLGSKVRVRSRTDTEITGRLTLPPKQKGTFFLAITKNGREMVTPFSFEVLQTQENKVSSLTLPPCGFFGPKGMVCQGSEPWWDGLEVGVLWSVAFVSLIWGIVYLLMEKDAQVRVVTRARNTKMPPPKQVLPPAEKSGDVVPSLLIKRHDNERKLVVVAQPAKEPVTAQEQVLLAAKSRWRAGRAFDEAKLLELLAGEPDLLKEWQAFKEENPKPPTLTDARQPVNIAGN